MAFVLQFVKLKSLNQNIIMKNENQKKKTEIIYTNIKIIEKKKQKKRNSIFTFTFFCI